jgi:hypothetical protein
LSIADGAGADCAQSPAVNKDISIAHMSFRIKEIPFVYEIRGLHSEAAGPGRAGIQLWTRRRSMAIPYWQAVQACAVTPITNQCVKKHRNIEIT